jgi:hypothetical protein
VITCANARDQDRVTQVPRKTCSTSAASLGHHRTEDPQCADWGEAGSFVGRLGEEFLREQGYAEPGQHRAGETLGPLA